MRTLLRKRSLYFLMATAMVISMTGCSAKSSADTENTTAEAETEIETEEETEEETLDSSGNDPSGNDVSDNDVSENDNEEVTEEETLFESEEEESTEDITKEETDEIESETETESESTNSKTSEKDSTKSETTTSETTTEAVTVQSVSAVVNGTHYVGETLTGADFTVTVKMSDGETLTNPAGWSAQPLTLNSTSNLITVAYEGASVTITVNAENVPETTTAAPVAATTQATTAATTAATTQAETTTAAPTTTAAETTTASEIEWVEWADGDYNHALEQALFIAQNEMRTEAGVDTITWDEQAYEVAKLCAKACGDAGVISHSLTTDYRFPTTRVLYTGEIKYVEYDENLQPSGALDIMTEDVSFYTTDAIVSMRAIKNSTGHYNSAIGSDMQCGAVAVYKMGDNAYISYIFYYGDDLYINMDYDPVSDMWYEVE